MGDQLYGQEALLDGLVPRLVGVERLGDAWVAREFPGGGPVVQIVGGRGAGKSALLDALSAGYRNRVPLALADLAAPGFGEPGLADVAGEESANASPVTHLLYLLSYKLGLPARSFRRRLFFPRLSCGLLPTTAWQPPDSGLTPDALAQAQNELRALLKQPQPNERRLRETVRQWLDALVPYLASLPGLPGLEAVATAVLQTARGPLLSSWADRGALRWWRGRLTQYQGSAEQRLFTMVGDFQMQDDGRRAVEELLIEAFLADIADHYGALSRTFGAARPLVLLDNAHTPVGARFLERLLSARRALADAAGDPRKPTDLPVVVVTSLGDGTAPPTTRQVGRKTPEPDGPLLRLGIPRAGADDIRAMLSARRAPGDAGYPPHLSRLIARFSGGRPGCAGIMVDAVADRKRAGGELRGPELLDIPASERARSVADRLAELLLPDQRLREDLTLLAPALDEQAARRLWLALGDRDPDPAPNPGPDPDPDPELGARAADRRLAAVTAELAGDHWYQAPWPWPTEPAGPSATETPLIGDRALRALLLHRLTRRSSPDEWRQTHRLLRAVHNPSHLPEDTVGHRLGYLHHTMALGRLEIVVRCLHQRLAAADIGPRAWLASVNVVCAAPHPPWGPAPEPVPGLGPCPACAGADGPVVHRAISRLVRGVWQAADPLTAVPDEDDVERVRTGLLTLSMLHDDEVWRAALHAWPARLTEGIQAPDLPVPMGGGDDT
ncbi:hypothetical protein [Streptomyces sp. NBC_01803]|uniref:hypothetical protein n=1 Tax=Streptomyces sp. NBC_01803 TaxID=2975946 RepID=UPI002DD9F9EE|nr:hypothetical protein [Streptomyces sp. NBC_01803]WSA43033.1 hypothetical protein OIE51_01785 [Streptomyces sp. NBC_01803]